MKDGNKNMIMRWIRSHRLLSFILLVLGVLASAIVAIAYIPFRKIDKPELNPASSYEEAMRRITAIQEMQRSNPDLLEVCRTKALTHGNKVENVIVLFHGFTSCPEQYAELGQQFYDRGYNVYIPLQPHHGQVDCINSSLPDMTTEELAAFGMQSVDIARGLGERVTVSGISGGGAITIWLAQVRDDIDVAMPVAPFLGINFIPASLNRFAARLLDGIPSVWSWWDPVKKENNPYTDEYQYPRFATHALAEYMRLGYAAELEAKVKAPVGKVIVVTNASEPSVNNDVIDRFVDLWQEHDGAVDRISSYRFERDLNLPHDIITPERYEGNLTVVYPKFFELLGME